MTENNIGSESGGNSFWSNILGHNNTVLALAIVLAIIIILVVIMVIPIYHVNYYLNHNLILLNEVPNLENEFRRTYAQIIGGIVLLVGLWFTYRRIVATEKNVEIAQKNLQTVQKGEITERLNGAIKHLNSKSLSMKIGGIYGLKRIAEEDINSRETIMEILSSYISEYSGKESIDDQSIDELKKLNSSPRDIIQSFYTIIDLNDEDHPVGIQSTNLVDFLFDEDKIEKGYISNVGFLNFTLMHLLLLNTNIHKSILTEGLIDDSTFDRGHWTKLKLNKTAIHNNSFLQILYKDSIFDDCDIHLNEYLDMSYSFFCLFQNSDLDHNTFTKHTFMGDKFLENSNLNQNKFIECNFTYCIFDEVSLTNNKFIQCKFENSEFEHSAINKNTFKECLFEESTLNMNNQIIENKFVETSVSNTAENQEFLTQIRNNNTFQSD